MTFPRPLVLTGKAAFNGGEHSMRVNADVVVDDRLSGRSHLVATGLMGLSKGVFTASDLHTRMLPLQTGLMKALVPKLFLSGTLAGTATLNGSSAGIMTAVGDVTHVDRGALSRATGRFAFRSQGVLWVDVDAQMHPLSLVTLGRFSAPTLGLRGNATGPMRLKGTINNLAINSQMTIANGGYVDVRGTMDLFSKETGYNLNFTTRDLNLNTVVAKMPSTDLTATGSARGRGFNPATMQAQLVADVGRSRIDTVNVDSANVRVALANGLARIDTLAVDLPEGIVEAKGAFGLTTAQTGTLSYHVAVDSLGAFSGVMGKDTGVVAPRPGILATRVARAKADSSRVARATEVERAISGRSLPRTVVDTPTAVARNQLSGSLRADGVATGNVKQFSLKGSASGSNIVARGNTVGAFTADYDWVNALTPQSQVRVDAQARSVSAAGFNLDSVGAKLTYHKPAGTLELVINQDNARTYAADAAFTLDKVRNELTLNNLKLQFDTSTWASTHASALHWGQAGVDVQNLELRNGGNGRIYVNGFVPKQGNANLDIAVDNLDVGDVIALTQSGVNAQGLVSLNVHATGTLDNPQFKGAFGATDLVYNGTAIPELHGNVQYANQTLSGRAEAMRPGEAPFLVAEGTVPINLAITGVTGSRFPADRQIALNVTADSLPLDMIPQLTTYVSNLKGKLASNFKIGGTLNHPQVTGQFSLHEGTAKVVPAGITLKGIEASIRMLGDTVVVDSVVAYNKGRIALTGGIGLSSLTTPSFDLHLQTSNAEVLKNERGNLFVSANLAMTGPFKDAHVTGDVRVRDGVLYIPPPENKNLVGAGDPALFNVLDTAVMSDKELFPGQSPLLANLRMDVNFTVDRDVFVRSREANIEVYSEEPLAIHVNRAKETLVIDGVLLTERGEYTFLTRRFNIKRGSATFINSTELNPTLQGTAEYEVREPNREAINIQIVVGGTLHTPNISLTSDAQPPITQSDLLSYLAFGRSSSSLLQLEGSGLTNGGGSGNVVGRGAALASRQLAGVALGVMADQLAGSAARSFGADVFTITPADVQTDVGNFLRATQFEFGKYIRSHTFVAVQSPLDPAALRRPGIQIVHRFGGTRGYRLETGVDTRYLLREPTLSRDQNIATTSAFGAFLIREWRF